MPTWECPECTNVNTTRRCGKCGYEQRVPQGARRSRQEQSVVAPRCAFLTDGYQCPFHVTTWQGRTTPGRTGYCEWHRYWLECREGIPMQTEFAQWIADMAPTSCSDWRHYPPDILWLLSIGSALPAGRPVPVPCLSRSCVVLWRRSPQEIADGLGRECPGPKQARQTVHEYLTQAVRRGPMAGDEGSEGLPF